MTELTLPVDTLMVAGGGKPRTWITQEMIDWLRGAATQSRRFGSICIYQARDQESIREHARRVGMPGDRISPVVTTVVVRDDPAAEASAAA